jgi:PAS domain S-box-containing protein
MSIALFRAATRVRASSAGRWYLWRVLIAFIVCFEIGYVLFWYQIYLGAVPREIGNVVSVIFLGGALFVLLCVEMLAKNADLDSAVGTALTGSRNIPFEPRAAWVVAAGTVCSLLVGAFFLHSSRAQWKKTFLNEIAAETADLTARIDTADHVLDSFKGFYLASERVSRDEFDIFARELLADYPYILALEWVPRVAHARRAAVERAAREDGLAGFRFTEKSADGSLVEAGVRDLYFPVIYASPIDGNERALGYDLASETSLSAALQKAMREGARIASEPEALVQNKTTAVLVYNPVYAARELPDGEERRERSLRGFILGVFQADRMFEMFLRGNVSTGLSLSVFEKRRDGRVRLYGTSLPGALFRKEIPVTVHGRQWKFVWEANHQYGGGSGGGVAILAAILTFAISVVLAFWLETLAQKARLAVAGERDRFFESTIDMVCIAGFDGYFKHLSPSWEKVLGFTLEELKSRPYIEFVHPEDVEATVAEGRRVEGGATTLQFYNRYRTKDGGWRWLSWLAAPYPEDGVIYATARDVTELREIQSDLAMSRERFDLAVRGSNDGIWDWDIRTDEVYFSDRWKTMLGYEPDEIEAGFDTWRDLIHPEDRDNAVRMVEEYLARDLDRYEQEVRMLCKDGSYKWILTRGAAVRDKDGKPLRLAGAHTDITDRIQAERGLREANARLEAIVNSPGEVIIAWIDQDGLFRGWNSGAERLLGYTAKEMVDKKTPVVLHDQEQLESRLRELTLKTGRSILPGFEMFYEMGKLPSMRSLEWTLRRKDRSEIFIQLYLTPFVEGDDRLGVLAIGVDVGRRKEFERVLAEARDRALSLSRAKSEFLANMSHEIRTPMNGVVGMTNLLLETDLSDEQRDFAETARASAESLLSVINDILDFSKVEAGKIILERVDFAPAEPGRDVVRMLSGAARKQGCELVYDVSPSLPARLLGDAGRLRQVLTNLIGNALKFTPKGRVEVRVFPGADAGEERKQVRFEVEDTGIGVPFAARSSLFDAFTQADSSTSRRFGGTGLGLAISKEIVSAMGGKIGFRPGDNGGSLFWFEIPFAPAEHVPEGSASSAGREILAERNDNGFERARSDHKSLLVAEDNPVNQKVTRSMLERLGYGVVVVDNGEKAVEAVRSGEFDAVLMDCQMPVMDGYEATRRIRALEGAVARIPIVGITAHAMREDRDRVLNAGMDDYLAKPVRLSDLRATLEKWVPVRKAAEELLDDAVIASLKELDSEEDAVFSALIDSFLKDAPGKLETIRRECEAGSKAMLESAHALKGASRSVGAARVGGLCEALEREGDAKRRVELVSELDEAFAKSAAALKSLS